VILGRGRSSEILIKKIEIFNKRFFIVKQALLDRFRGKTGKGISNENKRFFIVKQALPDRFRGKTGKGISNENKRFFIVK
jgi:hypothetical protein